MRCVRRSAHARASTVGHGQYSMLSNIGPSMRSLSVIARGARSKRAKARNLSACRVRCALQTTFAVATDQVGQHGESGAWRRAIPPHSVGDPTDVEQLEHGRPR